MTTASMSAPPVQRDERTTAVENASYRRAYLVLSFGMLISVAYRSFALHEASWDLLGLVVLGGGVALIPQARHRVLSRRWAVSSLLSIGVAALLAGLAVWFRR